MGPMTRSAEMEECIRKCVECSRVCAETITHCLHKGAKHAEASHIRLLLDCNQICRVSADFMVRSSDMHGRVCGVCAEVCVRCAEDCEKFSDDPEMLRCADICKSCAESCRRMANA